MLIQNFAENAIKHAFTDIDYTGHIQIETIKRENEIEVSIRDNGIGREKAMENFEKAKHKSGKGLGLIKQQVEIYNQLYSSNIRFEIVDQKENGKLGGTLVLIQLQHNDNS